jgi:Rrf2 family protein
MSSSNTRFRAAVHALSVIAYLPEGQATSDKIASSVATDPTVVRRLLSTLREAGLVTAAEGRFGGYTLARPAKKITLRDIFDVTHPDELFPKPQRMPNPECEVGGEIHLVLDAYLDDAREALRHKLARTSIADVLAKLLTK